MPSADILKFKPLAPEDKELYAAHLAVDRHLRGCEFSFSNLYAWGRQAYTVLGGRILLFSQFDRRSVYPYPVGDGDPKEALDAIIADATARGIPCRITGMDEEARQTLATLYPNRFRFHCDENNFDYVYDINDLADLAGKKYHSKRNHLARFRENYPHCVAEPLCEKNIPEAKQMIEDWYAARLADNPNADFQMEQAAINRAFRHYDILAMDGLLLRQGEEIFAVTLGNRLSEDTFDVQFEKARSDVQGAYVAINCAFARYLRDKDPAIRFLNREEDMGLEGLRKAKKSYYPHHMVKKFWAHLQEDGYDY